MKIRPAILTGIVRLARFDASGLACFGDDADAFMASLAPWVALTLVFAGLTAVNVAVEAAVEGLLVTVIVLLGPAVLSHQFARRWRREAEWRRYATAFNWCQWALPVAACLWLTLVRGAVSAGMPTPLAGGLRVGGVFVYAMALNWFLVRHGLAVSAGRALLVVLVTNVGTALLILVPTLVGQMQGVPS